MHCGLCSPWWYPVHIHYILSLLQLLLLLREKVEQCYLAELSNVALLPNLEISLEKHPFTQNLQGVNHHDKGQ